MYNSKNRSLYFLCLASLFAGLSIGYIKFFLLGQLVHSTYESSDKPWIIQTLGALLTLGPGLVFYFAAPLASAFKKSWIMYLSALTLAIVMLTGSTSNWSGTAWLYVFMAGLGLGVFNAARNAAIPIESSRSEHSTEMVNAWVNNLYIVGLLFGVPLGTETYQISPELGGLLNCLLFSFAALFGLLSSMDNESDHLKNYRSATHLLKQNCQELFSGFRLYLLISPILWGVAGALSLAATAFVESMGFASALLASLMSVYAAFGVGAGNFLATRLRTIRYKAAMISTATLALFILLVPLVAACLQALHFSPSHSYYCISGLMLVCGFTFGCSTNLIESEYLSAIYKINLEGTGAALLSANTAIWTFLLGGLAGAAMLKGFLGLNTQFIALAIVAFLVCTLIRKLEIESKAANKI